MHLLPLVLIALACACDAFTPADNYLIDCGSPTSTTLDGRIFQPDLDVSVSTPKTIFAVAPPTSPAAPPYGTARVFDGPSSYSFPIKRRGRHFLRLHFLPFDHRPYNLTAARFSVSAQGFPLLADFGPRNRNVSVSEFSLNVTSDTLTLAFTPAAASVAFVNAIEVVSVPDDLVSDDAQTLDPTAAYQGLPAEALETVYRLNVGGPEVTPAQDTLGRTWVPDQNFLIDQNLALSVNFSGRIQYPESGGATEDTAPDVVYATVRRLATAGNPDARFNMTWELHVDAGFDHLVRLHFCDVVSQALNMLYFNVYVNGMAARRDVDLSTIMVNTLAAPYYMDFVVRAGDRKLRVSVGPSTLGGVAADGILNGLEVMRIVNASAAGVAGPRSNIAVVIGTVIAAAVAAVLAVAVVVVVRRRRKCRSKSWASSFSVFGHSWGSAVSSLQHADAGLQFSLVVLREATGDFDEGMVIGVGGFGKVYKGVLRDGTKVAAKRGSPRSQQGLREFRTEIDLLSRLRHRHLVSLIGYCDEDDEMILVYEYMEKGTLKSHLYGGSGDAGCLTWKQRLEICVGAAKGLHYLHTGSSMAIIHRDVKSANILLDEGLMAKVADFGLSKTGPELDQTHVSTAVKGSFGYLDPEYFRRQRLTEKSDVYSFGVVLVEVLCARPVIDPARPREMVNLAEWAMRLMRRGEIGQVVDPRLEGEIRPESMRKFAETAEKCLAEYGVDRPAMGDVLWNLDYALQLQEAGPSAVEDDSINRIDGLRFDAVDLEVGVAATVGVGIDSEISMNRVFSQLMESEGR